MLNKTKIKTLIFRIADVCLSPLAIPVAFMQRIMRKDRFRSFPIVKRIYLAIGIYPIRNHYYEPLFLTNKLKKSLREDRSLPGIDFNIEEQLIILKSFNYNEELLKISYLPSEKQREHEFCYTVGPFRSGDAEYLYNMIRHFQPRKVIEIGSGHSTLMARKAIEENQRCFANYDCEHICVEPFENNWLEHLNIKIKRTLVEEMDVSYFDKLDANDILFIDSSHMIRPQGDVLYEYLELLPRLNKGVVVHIHDIFTPKDYLDEWVRKENHFWNEQYLLEAFLSHNQEFRVIGATNFLMHHYYDDFVAKCPILERENNAGHNREPGSFWMVKS